MMYRFVLLLLALVGCRPIPDRFSSAERVCAGDLTSACADHIRADFGAPIESPAWWLEGMHRFLHQCTRLTSPPRVEPYVPSEMVAWLETAPGEGSGSQLYNRVADAVAVTRFGEPGVVTAVYDPYTGGVLWDEDARPTWWTASILVHEASHAEGGSGHVPCPVGDRIACDMGWGGALGKQVAFAHWAARISEDPQEREAFLEMRDALRRDILTP